MHVLNSMLLLALKQSVQDVYAYCAMIQTCMAFQRNFWSTGFEN